MAKEAILFLMLFTGIVLKITNMLIEINSYSGGVFLDVSSMTVVQITQLLTQQDISVDMINSLKQDTRVTVTRLFEKWQQKEHNILIEKQRVQNLYAQERLLVSCGYNLIAGVDEAGRVILPKRMFD